MTYTILLIDPLLTTKKMELEIGTTYLELKNRPVPILRISYN